MRVESMGGSEDSDWEHAMPTTVVLVGKTGNGKSATGNSILGGRKFVSRCSSGSVTSTCELKSTTRPDDRCIRVVDTPGLFDPSQSPDFVMEEIVKCLELAKDGVHALLLVLSVRSRFTPEELEAVRTLRTLFGDKVVNYMMLVFTGGDELEDNEQTLEEYLQQPETPEALRAFIKECGNRVVLFDNKSKDKAKKEEQLSTLLSMIDEMVATNGGLPYSNDLLLEAKKLAIKVKSEPTGKTGYQNEIKILKETLEKSYAEQLQQVKEMVEEKIRLSAEKLEDCLKSEQRAREEVERRAQADKERSEAAIRKLQEQVEESERLREQYMNEMSRRSACRIL